MSLNISETGVLLRTARREPHGALLHLTFPTFASAAEVVWSSEAKGEVGVLLGMQFLSMGGKDREQLAMILGRPGTLIARDPADRRNAGHHSLAEPDGR
jgi:hypothetical protein